MPGVQTTMVHLLTIANPPGNLTSDSGQESHGLQACGQHSAVDSLMLKPGGHLLVA